MSNIFSNIDQSTLSFSARVNLYNDIRHPEDGQQLVGHAHYIIAETPDGRRFARHCLNGRWIVEQTEDGDVAVYLSDTIEHLQNTIKPYVDMLNDHPCPKLNPAKWEEVEPCYGTVAWQQWHDNQIFDKEYMNQ